MYQVFLKGLVNFVKYGNNLIQNTKINSRRMWVLSDNEHRNEYCNFVMQKCNAYNALQILDLNAPNNSLKC